MYYVKEVKTAKERRDFLNFPLKMYRDNPYFVPPLYADEKKIFNKNYVYSDTCDTVYFNAYDRDGRMAGRISGIIQKAANEKNNEKRVRFTRFDSINSQEVADMLFDAVEKWALDNGMDTVCGPLGFSDLEREGLLIEGFDQLSTFEEQYNAEYYQELISNHGFEKEVDWTESRLYLPEEDDSAQMEKTEEFVMNRYKLRIGQARNINDFLNKYADKFFDLLDRSYTDIYGTVPFSDGMKKMTIDNFRLIVDLKHVAVVLDENDNIVCLGICFPSIAEAVQKSQGHLTPAALVRLLKAIKKPRVIDLGLVGVDPAYLNRGITVIITNALMRMLKEDGVEYAETNLNLEDNYAIQNLWKRFGRVQHKRRRAYVKKLK